MNPPYRSSNLRNPSKVIFRHSTQFLRGCSSLDAWTAEATFSKRREKKWRERHFMCFGFVTAGLSFVFLFVWLFIILQFIRF